MPIDVRLLLYYSTNLRNVCKRFLPPTFRLPA